MLLYNGTSVRSVFCVYLCVHTLSHRVHSCCCRRRRCCRRRHCHDNRHRSSFIASVRTLFFAMKLCCYYRVYLTHIQTQVHHSTATAAEAAPTTIENVFLQTNNDRLQKKIFHRSYVRNEFREEKQEEKRRIAKMCACLYAWPTHWATQYLGAYAHTRTAEIRKHTINLS